ncbi:acetolactate synthase I/III small subunit [Blyttiomyces helicus]|uniref:Acetolactate synthase I/III small subunit n=1 Tax=Blyttiomyces helicus TaxID=388810 RepID=A0A4P9W8D4_9FUNG|nr:acetolactate synthase I/III small subunit [Blyttiomyces helicus]|eukprot:RKO87713.1 acetolactate synthase I/III small subunit [Blyttiomyces helicus]
MLFRSTSCALRAARCWNPRSPDPASLSPPARVPPVTQQRLLSTSNHLSATSLQLRKRRKKPAFIDQAPSPLSAEEAVNNILYNTPRVSATPVTRHVLNCLVSNEPGVLSRISGILAGRGFNIDSLVVARTEVPDLSRMTVVLNGQSVVIEQARRQLEDIVPVWAVLDYTHTKIVERELLLVKVSVVPHEHMGQMQEEELEIEVEDEEDLQIHRSAMSPLLGTALQRVALTELARLFKARIVDVSLDAIIIELCAKPDRIDAFVKLVKPYGIIEATRSGMMAMPRSRMDGAPGDIEEAEDEGSSVDATMLPPG